MAGPTARSREPRRRGWRWQQNASARSSICFEAANSAVPAGDHRQEGQIGRRRDVCRSDLGAYFVLTARGLNACIGRFPWATGGCMPTSQVSADTCGRDICVDEM